MKRIPIILATATMMFGLSACEVDDGRPEATPIDPQELQHISGNTELVETRDMLGSDGYSVRLENGIAFRQDGRYVAMFPVESEGDGACEYTNLIYQEHEDNALVYLELSGLDAPRKTTAPQRQGISCGGYSNWTSLGASWCGWAPFPCKWNIGTYDRESRIRQCCDATGHCWGELEYRTVMKSCGC